MVGQQGKFFILNNIRFVYCTGKPLQKKNYMKELRKKSFKNELCGILHTHRKQSSLL